MPSLSLPFVILTLHSRTRCRLDKSSPCYSRATTTGPFSAGRCQVQHERGRSSAILLKIDRHTGRCHHHSEVARVCVSVLRHFCYNVAAHLTCQSDPS